MFELRSHGLAISICMLAIGCGSSTAVQRTAVPVPEQRVAVSSSAPLAVAAEPAAPPTVKPAAAPPAPAAVLRPAAVKGKHGRTTQPSPQTEAVVDPASVAEAEAMIKLARSEVESSLR